jgi:hypothetical protein
LQTGATKQFTVTGAWSDGASRAVTPTFSASGGTISTGGLYAAGNTAGAYRVVASQGSVADSSTVTVTAPAPTLTGITVSPASASITAGSTQQFTASGTFSDGSTGAVTVSWSVNGGSITSSGLYTAPSSAGTYTVTATGGSGSVTGTASVTVTVSSPPPTGEPVPTSTSKVFFDTRPGGAQDYQKLNSLQEALAVWDVGYRGPVAWTTNMDGNGRHALRWDWSSSPTEQDGVVERSLPSVTGRMVTSWKIHLGRTSTGGGVGNVGYYGLNNGGGTKRFLWLRQDGTYRIYLVWRGYPSYDYNTFAIDGVSWNSNPISGNPYAYVGQEQRWTVEMVLPNTIRAWVNGVKVLDQSNANLGTTPFTSIQTPATMNYPAAAMSEYWYDVVVWQ